MITVKLCGKPGEAGLVIHAETIDEAIRIIKGESTTPKEGESQ